MYVVTFAKSFKMPKTVNELFFQDSKASIPLTEKELKSVIFRCGCYRFQNRIFSNSAEELVGSIVFNENLAKVKLKPVVKVPVKRIPPLRFKPLIDPVPDDLITFKEAEKLLIDKALTYTKGNQKLAAKLLGIIARTLRFKIKQYSIDAASYLE